jgi:two-component system alkaline phosphatase synthesis response regulator PhoP
MENMPKILIVDDDSNIRTLMKVILEDFEEFGVELLIAENGEEALEIIKTKKPDLVILDVMMPGMSGFDVCNMAKNVMGLKAIYILMLTVQSEQADRRRGNDVGADAYITKPFNHDELIQVVSEALGIEV